MALPTRLTLGEILRDAKGQWSGVKVMAAGYAVEFQSTTSSQRVIELSERLRGYRIALAGVAAVPGIGPYAQNEYAAGGYDIGADFAAMLAAMDAVRDWIVVSFPKDTTGTYILREAIAADGHVTSRTFTPADLAPLVALLQTLSATIE